MRLRLGHLGARARSESGITIPTAIWVMTIFMALALVTALVATNALSQSNRDREVKRAVQAADAGIEVAHYRMNKMLVLDNGILGLVNPNLPALFQGQGDLLRFGCVTATVDQPLQIGKIVDTQNLGASCEVSSGEGEELAEGARFRYWMSNDLNFVTPPGNIIRRRVLAEGRAGNVRRRIRSEMRLDLTKTPLRWERGQWYECRAAGANQAPDFNCT